ncbi:unnamed protein product [Paramecium sonneborni]|uniref:Uncharacterized protein n=1 Tax=Paramecium sonneborni TaxID=65129 RepID=A0A8S1R4K0_9CILI|nr:unnamed protein product [Paramecium sonneborni]
MNACQLDTTEKIVQFTIRMIVLSLALLSTLFVGITCLKSNKYKYWVFKLLFVQSFAESIDLIGAISLSFQSQCYENLCKIIGYIMHSCWLTSFTCLLLLFYLYYSALHINSKYQIITNNINKFIIVSIIWPYLWLLYPLLSNYIGPTGWDLYYSKEIFYLFCGFKKNKIIFLIFWSIPLWVILSLVLLLRIKIRSRIKNLIFEEQISTVELDIIKKVASFSSIYIFFWLTNQVVKYVQLLYSGYIENIVLYMIYVIIYLLFEIHLVIIAILFYRNYNKVIDIQAIWSFKKSKNLQNQYLEQLF